MLHVFRLTALLIVFVTAFEKHVQLRGGNGIALGDPVNLEVADEVAPGVAPEEESPDRPDEPDEQLISERLPEEYAAASERPPEEQAEFPVRTTMVDEIASAMVEEESPNQTVELQTSEQNPEEQATRPEEPPRHLVLTRNRTINMFQNGWSDAFPASLGDCCIVGSSDILNGAGRGNEIDSHQTVIRVNRLPTDEFLQDFGRRTDVIALNRLLSRRHSLQLLGGEYLDCIDAAVGEASCDFRAVVLKEVDENTAGSWLRAPFPVGVQDQSIRQVAGELLQGVIPSTGFTTVLTFVPLCETLTLYGFGPGKGTADGHVFKTQEEATKLLEVSVSDHRDEDVSQTKFHDLEAEHKILDLIALGAVPYLPSRRGFMTQLDVLGEDQRFSSGMWLREQLSAMKGRIRMVGG
jgi:hypothetical protein